MTLSLLCTADVETGKFIDLNPEWERVLGWTLEELRAEPFVHFVHPDDLESTIAESSKLSQGAETVDFENRYRHRDGGWVWLTWSSTVKEGRFFAAARDITEYKRNQEALALANEELRQFAYAASHDLQEPLRTITGYLSYIDRDPLAPKDQEMLNKVDAGARSMQDLLEGLLAFTRIQSQGSAFRPTYLRATVDEALAALALRVQETGARIDVSTDWPVLWADSAQMGSVLQNLLANALKFTRPGIAPEVHLSAEKSGSGWHLKVADNGAGFPQDRAERAFQIFQRLHRRSQFPGTGVGLAIVRRIISRHGGRSWLESEPDTGTTAHVWLPDDGALK
ncbi:MAG: PAS domain S-box-containing protein [Myxococcota bacterium]